MNYTLIPLKDGGWEVRADSRFAPPLTLDEARRVLVDALEAVTDQRAAERRADHPHGDRASIEAAAAKGEPVELRWFNRRYTGTLLNLDDQGFLIHQEDGEGCWCGWDSDFELIAR